MADDKNGVENASESTVTLTDEEVDKAMAQAFDREARDEEPKPEPSGDEVAAEDKGGDQKVTFEDMQKVRRELGNQKRLNEKLTSELTEIKEQLRKLPTKTSDQREVKDELSELLEQAQAKVKSGDLDESTGSLIGQMLSLMRKQKAQQKAEPDEDADGTRQAIADIKAERAFNAQFPELTGQWQKLSDRAWEIVQEEDPDSSPQEQQAAANFALKRLAKTLSKAAKDKARNGSNTVKDNTAKAKPSSSTKGATTVQSSAAPSKDDLSQMTDEQIEELQAKILTESDR